MNLNFAIGLLTGMFLFVTVKRIIQNVVLRCINVTLPYYNTHNCRVSTQMYIFSSSEEFSIVSLQCKVKNLMFLNIFQYFGVFIASTSTS